MSVTNFLKYFVRIQVQTSSDKVNYETHTVGLYKTFNIQKYHRERLKSIFQNCLIFIKL